MNLALRKLVCCKAAKNESNALSQVVRNLSHRVRRKGILWCSRAIGMNFKGSVSSSIPCTCRYLTGLCLSPFSWPMKMATTKEKQEMTRARHAG